MTCISVLYILFSCGVLLKVNPNTIKFTCFRVRIKQVKLFYMYIQEKWYLETNDYFIYLSQSWHCLASIKYIIFYYYFFFYLNLVLYWQIFIDALSFILLAFFKVWHFLTADHNLIPCTTNCISFYPPFLCTKLFLEFWMCITQCKVYIPTSLKCWNFMIIFTHEVYYVKRQSTYV